eukprot:9469270-Pyramimonas_sp.AAC.2
MVSMRQRVNPPIGTKVRHLVGAMVENGARGETALELARERINCVQGYLSFDSHSHVQKAVPRGGSHTTGQHAISAESLRGETTSGVSDSPARACTGCCGWCWSA